MWMTYSVADERSNLAADRAEDRPLQPVVVHLRTTEELSA
jgi:hypothetical protein